MTLTISKLSKSYGGEIALAGLDLTVKSGTFTAITGPAKCGKSVLFRLLVGLEKADAGTIVLDGEDITDEMAARRKIGYVPQSFALYPNLNVYDNIAYPLALAKESQGQIKQQVDRAASMLSITGLLTKTPDLLSGGEKQRTALARGLLKNATTFILDDPLVGLDYKLREQLVDDLKDLREELGATFLYATSDSIEALRLASDIVIMDAGGTLLQQAAPESAYLRPANARAMELLGFPTANLLEAEVANGVARSGRLELACPTGSGKVTVGFRPENVRLGPPGEGIPATVSLVEDLGGEVVVYIDALGTPLTAAYPAGDHPGFQLGAQVGVAIAPDALHLFPAAGA